jgi:hypothetical protein
MEQVIAAADQALKARIEAARLSDRQFEQNAALGARQAEAQSSLSEGLLY